jgi:hypothetical protein
MIHITKYVKLGASWYDYESRKYRMMDDYKFGWTDTIVFQDTNRVLPDESVELMVKGGLRRSRTYGLSKTACDKKPMSAVRF